MTKFVGRAGLVLATLALMCTAAFAKPPRHPAKKASMTKPGAAMCPVCRMPLSTHKTKATPVAIKYHGKIMYCCAKCKMLPTMYVKPHKGGAHHAKMGKMGHMRRTPSKKK